MKNKYPKQTKEQKRLIRLHHKDMMNLQKYNKKKVQSIMEKKFVKKHNKGFSE